jgi:sugar lactone lactonase YvrE
MIVALALAAYLSLWPVPIEPVAWQAPAAPGYTAEHAANTRLAAVQKIALDGESGPEHVTLGPDGQLYTGMASGHILRMKPDGSGQAVFSDTGGRPLGMGFDADGKLIVADALKGLLSIAPDGKATVLAAVSDSGPLYFPDGAVVAGNGKIYLTDASQRFGAAKWGGTLDAATLDILEQSSTGRVLEYNPATKALRVVATGLSFANGIALTTDEQFLLVSETGRYRIWKIAVPADRLDLAQPTPLAKVLIDNLPGYPDNLTRGLDGKFWMGLAGPRNDLDAMAERPYLRRVILRLPRMLWPVPKPYGHVVAFSEEGKVLADLQDPSGNSPLTTGVTETPERLYIHSVDGHSLEWLPPHPALSSPAGSAP